MNSRITKIRMTTAAACMALVIVFGTMLPSAAQVVSTEAAGFDVVGFIQTATINPTNTSDILAGGTITVNDITIVVPRNSIVQMPAATLSWGQVFLHNPLNPALGPNLTTSSITGMALDDCGTTTGCLPGTYEAHVQGNIVNPGTADQQYVAGLIFLSQQSLNATSGYIQQLDYAHGAMMVNGTWVQINDPKIQITQTDLGVTKTVLTGRHSAGQSPDVRFTVDQDNPTVRSETGYPMCIPRQDPAGGDGDPRCPQRNRPRVTAGGPLVYNFTMAAPRANPTATAPDLTITDPWEQMPFEVGDFVTYWGVIQNPVAGPFGARFVSAYQVIGNVGAYTFPGTNPAYIGIDVLLQGTGGVPNPAFPQEVTSKVKVEGFSTDATRTVDILALDQDCNGTLTDRLSAPWALAFTVDPGPPTGAKKGRFRFRPLGGAFLPPVSQVRVRVTGYTGYLGPSPLTAANGLIYGQYHAPDFAFVFPENLGVGDPILTYNLQDFAFLVNGVGPWSDPLITSSPIVTQLSPWPDQTVNRPTPSCTFGAPSPTLNASFTATPNPAVVNNPITLDATAALESGANSFTWSPLIQCANTACSTGTFTPTKAGSQTFTLNVTGAGGGTATSSVTVTVNNPTTTTDVVTITNVVYRISKARLDVSATSSIVQPSPSTCTTSNLQPGCLKATLDIINTATGQPYTALMQNLGNGTYTVTFTGIPSPNLVTVQSGNGGSATSGVTRVR